MINPKQLLEYVIRPVLIDLDVHPKLKMRTVDGITTTVVLTSDERNILRLRDERLILGTACQESGCGHWLHQVGGGPALGIWQQEPDDHDDIFANFLAYKPNLLAKVSALTVLCAAEQMIWNLKYACAMCRIHYLRVPEPIPDYLAGQAKYWNENYNRNPNYGTDAEYMSAWNRFVAPDRIKYTAGLPDLSRERS